MVKYLHVLFSYTNFISTQKFIQQKKLEFITSCLAKQKGKRL